MKHPWIHPALTAVLLGCGHGDAFVPDAATVGPSGTGSDVRLTFNSEQDYWPAWTEDGRGVLYSFVEPAHTQRRCIGLLPAAGGTRIWQFCDNRATQLDTTSSYTAYALGADGRLLYTEAAAPLNATLTPTQITLWLADTAAPTHRTGLLTLPHFVGSNRIGLAQRSCVDRAEHVHRACPGFQCGA